MTDKKTTPTLELILQKMGKSFSEEKVHAALLLSFVESAYSVIRRDCTPSPLYRVSFDKTNHSMTMEELRGYSRVPKKNSLDIDDLDILLMSDLREIPILWEGETGIGKTFVSQRYLSTALKTGQYFSYRLSSNAFLNNLFSHFQEGKMVNGMPVIEAKMEKIESTAAGIVDEISRGDPNETLQLFDNEMHLGGLILKLGIPIPDINDFKYKEKGAKKKRMLLVAAQNPASSDDAKFTGSMQLDAAVDNRLLKVYMSNAAPSAGSTLWLSEGKGKRHDNFLNQFKKRASASLGIGEEVFSGIENDWLSVYAWITDAGKTDKPILYSGLEMADFMTAVFSGNLIEYYNYERNVLDDWDEKLKKGVKIADALSESEKIKKMHEVTSSFKVPVIFRDVGQIKKVADILSTLKNIKDSLNSTNPVQTYEDARKLVSVREVAEATALVARNKQRADSVSPVYAINEVVNQYCRLCEECMKDAKKLGSSFDIYDSSAGIKDVILLKAVRGAITDGKGIDGLINEIVDEAKKMISKISVSEGVRNIMIARSAGDLMTLCGFLDEYKAEISSYKEDENDKLPLLKKYKKPTEVYRVLEGIGKFYCQKQKENAAVLPDIYQHRIQRTLGIDNAN